MNSSLDTLRNDFILRKYSDCKLCDLCHSRTQVVPSFGKSYANVIMIGEAPGEEEDRQGEPFVGKAGQKLNRIINYIGLKRENVYIANSVMCRPPDNRTPRPGELEACRQRLIEEIWRVDAKLIVLLGRVATTQILGEFRGPLNKYFPENMGRPWIEWHDRLLLVTYHPSYHLRSPERAYQVTLPHWTQVKKWLENDSNR